MKVQEIRKRFTSFFEKNGHQKINSSSLIPHNDKTLMFANAGMNQFKDYFTGQSTPASKRATTIQKCVRAGGKHNDLENVGLTARHHTFFEMLGNFSFGDYFKKDAIEMAWKFLTEELNIDKSKLYVTVHHSDDEAFDLWENHIGLSKDRIFKKGDKDNFWEMGEYGPCGPCSEIFYDHGAQYTDKDLLPKDGGDILDDELRYVEIWNLVFMQFEKSPSGTTPLPNPSIDTGMGLERVAAVLQGKYWNYDTDCFTPIIQKIESISGKKYDDPKYQSAIRIISDHVRSCVMLITDGVTPSNEGRGYVLRRIIRRAVRYARELGAAGHLMKDLVPEVFTVLGDEYPQNKENVSLAEKFLELEEQKFLETLDNGMKYLLEEIKKSDGKVLDGKAAFKLYDTYGFPLDLTEVISNEKGLSVNTQAFDQAMEERKEESRKSWKGGMNEDKTPFFNILEKNGETNFVGNNQSSCNATLIDIVEMREVDAIIFDQTPFYGEGGGQVGDTGEIRPENGEAITVQDTQKPVDGLTAHLVSKGHNLKSGDKVELIIESQKRKLIQRNHSATHLLQAALIKVLGDHVNQSGSMVNSERLRFDFTHMQAMTSEELKNVENLVNQQIQNALNVTAETMSLDKARGKGAMALFGEKYGDEVRVLTMGDFSIELCGGTHVNNTSDIGLFTIVSESSLSTGVRRLEAMTSSTAHNFLKGRSDILKNLELLTNSKENELVTKVQNQIKEIKSLNKKMQELEQKIMQKSSDNLFENMTDLNNDHRLCIAELPEGSDLRKMSDHFIDKNPNDVVLMLSPKKDKYSILLKVNKKLSIKCNSVLGEALPLLGGRGGGKPDMAQGSGDMIDTSEFKSKVTELLKAQLN